MSKSHTLSALGATACDDKIQEILYIYFI